MKRGSEMLEKLILAAAITFSLNFFLAVNSQQADSELFLGGNQTANLSAANSYANSDLPPIASAIGQQ